jgi:hypothetical protein
VGKQLLSIAGDKRFSVRDPHGELERFQPPQAVSLASALFRGRGLYRGDSREKLPFIVVILIARVLALPGFLGRPLMFAPQGFISPYLPSASVN